MKLNVSFYHCKATIAIKKFNFSFSGIFGINNYLPKNEIKPHKNYSGVYTPLENSNPFNFPGGN